MATIQNNTGGELRILQIGNLGIPKVEGVNLVLQDTETGVIPDNMLRDNDGIIGLRASGDITVISFTSGDDVVEGESLHRTAYSISLDNSPGDIATGAGMVAAIALGATETFDFSNPADRVLVIVANGVTINHTFQSGDFTDIAAGTAAEIVTSLDGNAAFAAEASANDDSGDIDITSLSLGTSSTLVFSGAADAILALEAGVTSPGTKAPSLVQILVSDATGNPLPGVNVDMKIFDAVTAGSLLAATQLQEATKGTFSAGKYSNDATGTTNSTGELDVEVATSLAADSLFLDLAAPAGFFLSISDTKGADSTRDEIIKTA